MAQHTIDYETYYASDFTLSKMQVDEYVLDPRFHIILVGVDHEWFSGTHDEIRVWLQGRIDFENDELIAHNAMFDAFITTQILNLKPAKWIDTLGMARACLPHLKSHSLASLAKHFKFQDKGETVTSMLGRTLASMSRPELATYGAYCVNDCDLTRRLYEELAPLMPSMEMALIDMSVRMFSEPKLSLDPAALEKAHKDEVQRKADLLQVTGLTKETLMSNVKFAAALEALGVEPPMKISQRTGLDTYAFAKSDKNFTALQEHEDPLVQALVSARLGIKSTIAETRALRLLNTAKRGTGRLPVALNYWGAKTTGRYSGGNGINLQNVPARGRGSELRKAIVPPPGHVLVVGDSANIELRVAMACAGQDDAIDKLRTGTDLYCDFASAIFNRPITKEDKPERFLGKVGMLSLQYGAGAPKFQEIVRIMAKQTISLDDAEHIVGLYREIHNKIVALWSRCNNVILPAIHNLQPFVPLDVNNWFVTSGIGFSHPPLPGVNYSNLRREDNTWIYEDKKKIYGGKCVENLCQHMARHVVMWQTACINDRYPVALSVHDEIVCVVPESQAESCAEYMTLVLNTAPKWCREKLPVGCEVHIGTSYGDAKS